MSVNHISTHLEGLFNLSTWTEDVAGPFGLHPPPGDWDEFKRKIAELQAECGSGESIKVIYAARHGQAEHNLLGEKYGYTEANERFPVVDPVLTDLGRQQAGTVADAFKREITRGMPAPTIFFVSPLRRCGETLEIEWGWFVEEQKGTKDVPAIVIEAFREHLLLEQCDKRNPLHQSKARFPGFAWPENMIEDDVIFADQVGKGRHETEEELLARTKSAVADLLAQAGSHTYISLTSHSGALRGAWKALGVPARSLAVGEMNVLVVKITKA